MRIGKLIVNRKLWIVIVILLSVFLGTSYADKVVLTNQQTYTFTVPDHDVSLVAETENTQNNTWWDWVWGRIWRKLRKDVCPDWDFSDSYYDWLCENPKGHGSANCDDNDTLCLYNWAFSYDITTIDTFEKSNPDWYVKRWHMAKMVVNFMINVLWKNLPSKTSYECQTLKAGNWWWESQEIHDYAIKSCMLWVMWINMPNNEFRPNDIVNRAEFGTILSRIIWWSKYNIKHTDTHPYYEQHLQMLKEEGIMTQIESPMTRKELRKRARLMLKRLAEK